MLKPGMSDAPLRGQYPDCALCQSVISEVCIIRIDSSRKIAAMPTIDSAVRHSRAAAGD